MMRRYPVRSVLSERKMFSNGGMLPTSKPVESSMNQPSGILASSSPLIDAVSQEILAPMTGGAMPMANGGVARFRNGGINDKSVQETRARINRVNKIVALVRKGVPVDEAIQIVDGEGTPDVQVDSRAGPPRKDMNFLDPSPSANMFGSIYGQPDLPEGGPSFTNVNDGLLSLLPNANRPSYAEELASKERARNLNTPNLSESVIKTNPVDPRVAERIIGLGKTREIVQDPGLPESGETQPLESFALDKLVRQRMAELGTTNEIVQDPGLPESGGTPPSGLSEVDALTRQRMAELGTTRGIIQDPSLPESGGTQPPSVSEVVDPLVAERLIELGKTREIIQDPSLPESGNINSILSDRKANIASSVTPEAIEAGSKTFSEAMSDNSGLKKVGEELSDVARIALLTGQDVPLDQARERVEGERAQAIAKQQQDASASSVDEQLELGEGPDAEGPTFNFSTAKPEQVEEPQAEAQPDEPELTDLEKVDQDLERGERLQEALRGGDVKTDIGIGDNFTVDEAEASTTKPGSPAAGSDVASENKAYISSPDNMIEPFNKTDMPEKEATKTLADYKQKFMDEMPEYEGMSESEKGFALMEAGLRVAAGESPNAITNVAKGLKGLGATFAKDEKEKRAWNRSIELSATKYSLENESKDRAQKLALAKEGRGLKTVFWTEDVFGPDGQLRGSKGTSGFITNNEIHSGSYDGKFEAGITLAAERLKNKNSEITAQLRRMIGQTRKGGPSDTFFNESLKSYSDASLKLSDYATQLALVDSSAKINDAGGVTGIGAYAARKLNSFYNVFNINRGKGDEITSLKDISEKDIDSLKIDKDRKDRLKSIRKMYGSLNKQHDYDSVVKNNQSQYTSILDKFAGKGRESEQFFAQQQELANLLIKEILGEGSKNVSNIDRELASEIVGLYSNIGSISADPAIIGQRLDRIRQRILKNYEATNNQMNSLDGQFSNIVDRGYRNAKKTYFDPVRRSALGQIEAALGKTGRTQVPVGSPYTASTVNGKLIYRFN